MKEAVAALEKKLRDAAKEVVESIRERTISGPVKEDDVVDGIVETESGKRFLYRRDQYVWLYNVHRCCGWFIKCRCVLLLL